ncbi:MAG: EamA family transporter, partial [Phototrophicales bacterium]
MSSPPKFVGLILAVGILTVSTAAIFIRLAIAAAADNSVGFSLTIGASRLAIASIVLLPGWQTIKPTKIARRNLIYAIAAGIFLALHFACWITSLAFTSIAASTTLVTTNPIWVTLIYWIWHKQRPSIKTILGIVIAVGGSIVVAFSDSDSAITGSMPLWGNSLALAGAITVSCYMVCGKQAQQNLDMTTYITIAYSTAALIMLPLPLVYGYSYWGYSNSVYM